MASEDIQKQVKSRKRVVDHGEVFTNEREVKAMCDLVSLECDRIDSKFLEPACGDGNFLAEIVRRKLETVKKLHRKNPYDYERYSVLAMSSIYGVDIMQDNVDDCRARLFELWDKEYLSICKKECNNDTREAVIYILSKNILCGNALTLMCVDKECNDTDDPVIFPEWSLMMGTKLKRRDYRLDVLLKAQEKPVSTKQYSLFQDNEISKYLSIHPATGEYVPLPVREYPPIHYRKIQENN